MSRYLAGKIHIVIIEGEAQSTTSGSVLPVSRSSRWKTRTASRSPEPRSHSYCPNQGAGATFANGARSLTITTDAQGRAVARGAYGRTT